MSPTYQQPDKDEPEEDDVDIHKLVLEALKLVGEGLPSCDDDAMRAYAGKLQEITADLAASLSALYDDWLKLQAERRARGIYGPP